MCGADHTADHGNADEMFELDKKTKQPAQNKDGSFKAKTAHTLNPVPLILYDNVTGGKLGLKQTETAGLSNIAGHDPPTCSAWRSTPSGTKACWKSDRSTPKDRTGAGDQPAQIKGKASEIGGFFVSTTVYGNGICLRSSQIG